jgi:amino acid transporter
MCVRYDIDIVSYALQWLVVLPLEIIAASITVGYWNSNLDRAIFITIFLFTIVVINLFGVKGYGEAEFVFAIVKITAVIGFMQVYSLSILTRVLLTPSY